MALEAPEDLSAPSFTPEPGAEFAIPEVDAAIPTMPEAGAAQPIGDQADQDSALAWLESLAAGQGVSEEELITPPGERSETPPDWIKVAAEAELAEAAIRAESEEEIPAWLQAEEGPAAPGAIPTGEQLPIAGEEISPGFPEAPSAEVPLEVPSDQDAAFAWLESLAVKQGADEEELLTQPDERLESPPEWVALAAEAEISAPEPVEIPTEIEIPSMEQVEIPVVPPTLPEAPQEVLTVEALVEPSVEMPPHKLDINSASLAELEALPGIGFVLAQNIIAYRETYGPYQSITDLEKISGIGPVLVEELQDQIMVAEVAAVPEAVSEEAQLMQEASTAIGLGDIAPAVQNYSILIKKRYHLPELIDELQAALYRFPVDVDLWQTIGDAYVRSDRLQDALDAYTKAEELIR